MIIYIPILYCILQGFGSLSDATTSINCFTTELMTIFIFALMMAAVGHIEETICPFTLQPSSAVQGLPRGHSIRTHLDDL